MINRKNPSSDFILWKGESYTNLINLYSLSFTLVGKLERLLLACIFFSKICTLEAVEYEKMLLVGVPLPFLQILDKSVNVFRQRALPLIVQNCKLQKLKFFKTFSSVVIVIIDFQLIWRYDSWPNVNLPKDKNINWGLALHVPDPQVDNNVKNRTNTINICCQFHKDSGTLIYDYSKTIVIMVLLIITILITLNTGDISFNDITFNWFYF